MKKITKLFAVVVSAITSFVSLVACTIPSATITTKTEVDTEIKDVDIAPTIAAPYAEESAEQFACLEEHFEQPSDGSASSIRQITEGNDEVKQITAKLFAYACYNENFVSQFVYLSDRSSSTTLDGGLCESTNQDYKAIVRKTGDVKGMKYHYTIKHVDKAQDVSTIYKNAYESNGLRFVNDTLLYRFKGTSVGYRTEKGRTGELTATWNKKGSDWGKEESSVVLEQRIDVADIPADIVERASTDDFYVKGNLNIFAQNIIKSVSVIDYAEQGYTLFQMTIDTDVANSDPSSLAMLRHSNSSNNCVWNGDGLQITFVLWKNGLFRSYSLSESWVGTISVVSGVSISGGANSDLLVEYSYSDRDVGYEQKMTWFNEALSSLS
jgi:hypothetical protein